MKKSIIVEDCIRKIKSGEYERTFNEMYSMNAKEQKTRYAVLVDGFKQNFEKTGSENGPLRLFSSPGRTEIGGNHTDHQCGKVLAGAVELDAAAAVMASDDGIIRIKSVGYDIIVIDTKDTSPILSEQNTTPAIVRGIVSRVCELGYKVGGFSAYADSFVPVGSGLSSSASFENLVTTILNSLYNENSIDAITVAQIGKYAENVYFGKPSGLMDQMASAIGGVVAIDFEKSERPEIEKIPLNVGDYDYSLCVVNTGGDHAELTGEYAEIFAENLAVAKYFGKSVLREVSESDFTKKIPDLRSQFGDRAVLRAMHFFGDNKRVTDQVQALKDLKFDKFLKLVRDSGESSFNRLQNVYSASNVRLQPLSLALEYTRNLLEDIGGSWRVHGGGFAGTIQAYVPTDFLNKYTTEMNKIFGENAVQILAIRPMGSCEVLI